MKTSELSKEQVDELRALEAVVFDENNHNTFPGIDALNAKEEELGLRPELAKFDRRDGTRPFWRDFKPARYRVIPGSESGHCCFDFTVMDTHTPNMIGDRVYEPQTSVCECFDKESAELICIALNTKEAEDNSDSPL